MDPFTLGSIFFTLMSAYKGNEAQKAVNAERNQRMQEERKRQEDLQRQADIKNQAALQAVSPAAQEADQAKNQIRREQQIDQVATQNAPQYEFNAGGANGSGNAQPIEVKSEIARQIAKSLAKGRAAAKAGAAINAYGDTSFGTNMKLNRNAQDLGQITNFSQGSQAVLPYELQGANTAGGSQRQMSDIFGTAGTAMSLYGAYQKPTMSMTDKNAAMNRFYDNF